MNKRGADPSPIPTIATFVIIIIVVIILGGIFLNTTGEIETAKNVLSPETLTLRVEACRFAAEQANINEFCYVFKEVDDKVWVSCQDQRVIDILSEEGVNYAAITCNPERIGTEIESICAKSGKGSFVDGEPCPPIAP